MVTLQACDGFRPSSWLQSLAAPYLSVLCCRELRIPALGLPSTCCIVAGAGCFPALCQAWSPRGLGGARHGPHVPAPQGAAYGCQTWPVTAQACQGTNVRTAPLDPLGAPSERAVRPVGVDVQPVWSPGNSHEQLGRPPALWRALGSVGLPRPVFPPGEALAVGCGTVNLNPRS